jgi:hypothetical protein
MVAALAAILLGTTASASAAVGAETRVGAISRAVEVLVEPPQHETAGQRLGRAEESVETAVATGVAAETGASVSSRVAAQLDDVKSIVNEHGIPLNKFGDGYLWANKDANLALRTPKQLAAVQERGFTPSQISRIRDYYRAVDEASGGANPSASYRADLMQYYLDNWGG